MLGGLCKELSGAHNLGNFIKRLKECRFVAYVRMWLRYADLKRHPSRKFLHNRLEWWILASCWWCCWKVSLISSKYAVLTGSWCHVGVGEMKTVEWRAALIHCAYAFSDRHRGDMARGVAMIASFLGKTKALLCLVCLELFQYWKMAILSAYFKWKCGNPESCKGIRRCRSSGVISNELFASSIAFVWSPPNITRNWASWCWIVLCIAGWL